MKILLAECPMGDPTRGYHSLPYFSSFAKKNGFRDISIRDLNIEFLNHLATEDSIRDMQSRVVARREELEAKGTIDWFEQQEYFNGFIKEYMFRLDPKDVADAIKVFRDPETFFEIDPYYEAVKVMRQWEGLISSASFPHTTRNFYSGFSQQYGLNQESTADIANWPAIQRGSRLFLEFLEQALFPEMENEPYDVIGLNLTYPGSFWHSLALTRTVRERFPNTKLLLGGTHISGWWKYLDDKQKAKVFFDYADYLVCGEGETAFIRILESIAESKLAVGIPNVVTFDREKDEVIPFVGGHYEDLNALATPEYDDLPWDLYFSPFRFALYAPTRGCYWDKCTFCDYGLNNNRPTSPWRWRRTELVIEDLQKISAKYPYVYFAADVIAPSGMKKVAQGIVDAGLDITWSTNLRLERRIMDQEFCNLLYESGCVAMSTGFESGNQRVLDMMQKGTNVVAIKETIKNYRQAGIGVVMMAFKGFPTETFEEAMDSINFLVDNQENWDIGGLGTFVLTSESIVAKRPEAYGLYDVRRKEGHDSCTTPLYSTKTPFITEEDDKELDRLIGERLPGNPAGRPFAGGGDATHTIFYQKKYGPDCFKMVRNFFQQKKELQKLQEFTREALADPDERLKPDVIPYVAAKPVHNARYDLYTIGERGVDWDDLLHQLWEDEIAETYEQKCRLSTQMPTLALSSESEKAGTYYRLENRFFRPSKGAEWVLNLINGKRTLQELYILYGGQEEKLEAFIRDLCTRGVLGLLRDTSIGDASDNIHQTPSLTQ